MDVVNGKVIRDRNWFITINPQAECYINFKELLHNQKNLVHYAYIYHKADEDNINENHIHLVLEYKNARTFETIQNIFLGSHIEHMKFKCQCYKYLIHKGYDDKVQYSIDKVICDNIEYYKSMINSDEFERLDTSMLLNDINNNDFDTITDFIKKYGINQVKTYLYIIKSVLYEKEYNTCIDDLKTEIEHLKRVIVDRDNRIKELVNQINDLQLPF